MKVNELELRVFGLMRSGNHAIIDWIISLHPNEKICFLNNVEYGGVDPYLTCYRVEHHGFSPEATIEDIRRETKRLLIYSYEDNKQLYKTGTGFLDAVFDPAFEECRQEHLGVSRQQRNLLIIRDPFNCLASRMMHIRERGLRDDLNDLQQIADNWKAIARRALDNDPENDDLVILYNHWVGSQTYRKKLAATLGGRSSEDGAGKKELDADGSSFGESHKKSKPPGRLARGWRATTMRVRRLMAWVTRSPVPVVDSGDDQYMRWSMLRRDPLYRELFKDPELLQLSRALFGEIAGTGMFARRLWNDDKPEKSAEATADPGGVRKATS